MESKRSPRGPSRALPRVSPAGVAVSPSRPDPSPPASTALRDAVQSGPSRARGAHTREALAVLGLCDECRRPSFIDTAPPSLAGAVAQAALYDRMPKVLPRSEAVRVWQAGVCDCHKGRIVASREVSS